MASSLGKMPTTSVRRLISPLRRSMLNRMKHRFLTALSGGARSEARKCQFLDIDRQFAEMPARI
jgi:hypothetical protein